MSTGDKRYLGDVFINQENYERQKQFFRDIIDSYQYKYGGTFDAATLQGFEPDSFATREQGERADNAILSPLRIGKKEIINIEDAQYIYTDAVLLDREDGRLDAINWYNNLTDDNMTDALVAIYNQVISIQDVLQQNIDTLDSKKLDIDDYDDFYENDYTPLKNDINGEFEDFTDQYGNVSKKINAHLINGLRFILITQSAYDNLPETDKNYWRNIYIIKDPSEIPPDYVDPMSLQLTDGYIFAINNGNLEVSNGLTDNWKTICSLDDLLSGANFNQIVYDFLVSGSYIIPPENIIDSLENVLSSDIDTDWENYPFLSSSLHDDYVKTIKINGSSTNVTESVNLTNKFKTVNLDIENEIQASSTISNIQTNLNTAQSDITSIKDNIGNIDIQDLEENLTSTRSQISNTIVPNISTLQSNFNTHNTKINSLERSTQSMNTQLSNIRTQIIDNEKFDVLIFNKYSNKINFTGKIFNFEKAGTVFLKRQGICYVYFYFASDYDFEWTSGPNYVKISEVKIPEEFRPQGEALFIPVHSWNSGKIGVIKIQDGDIYYANTLRTQSGGFNILANFSYVCNGFMGQNSQYINQTYDPNRPNR